MDTRPQASSLFYALAHCLFNTFSHLHKSALTAASVTKITVFERPGPPAGNLWRGSQYLSGLDCIVHTMSAKYYTQFRLNDTSYQGGNEFSGVVELNRPIDQDWEVADIEAVLAKNFDLQQNDVTLLSWSRLH